MNRSFFILYILIVLSSLSFFNPLGLIPSIISKFIYYVLCLIGLFYSLRRGKNLKHIVYPRSLYRMIIFGIIMSIFMASFFQNQSFLISLIATLPYLFGYITFYILMKLNVPTIKIEKVIWTFCYISMGIYIINVISFPNIIFGTEKEAYDMSRGVIRLGIMLIELIVLFFFYSINQWILFKKKVYILLIFLTALFIVLSVTRQYILLSFGLGFIFILQKASLAKKIAVIVFCFFIYKFVLPQLPMYNAMVELTEAQAEKNEYDKEDIRIQAWQFYTYEYQTNSMTAILGNGVPSLGNSQWGNEFREAVYPDYGGNGCFTSDVGWAGFYWNYGLFATLGLFFLLLKAAFKKKEKKEQYLSYWCIFIIITSVASGPIIIYYQIISIMTVLYLIYGKENNGTRHLKLQ